MDALNELRESVRQLSRAFNMEVAGLATRFECDPLLVKDTHGRPYVLDMLTTLVSAQTAIVNAEKESNGKR